MGKEEVKCLLVSDFSLDNFAAYMRNNEDSPRVTPVATPFGQVVQVLVGENLEWEREKPDVAVVWTQPQAVIQSFNQVLNYHNVSFDTVLREVDDYCGLIKKIKKGFRAVFLPAWVLSSYCRGYGMLDMKNDIGIANLLMRMNLRVADNMQGDNSIYLLNTQKWIEDSGKNPFNQELWYMAKIPFGNEVFKHAVKDIKSALLGISGKTKKLIILDLDDTLWGGIVGDVGWENVILGGHDALGEAFVDFQRALKALTNRGILLGLVSKNEESVALEGIEKHPEMVLKLDDFAGWRINWGDKAQNVLDLVSELNLGIDSAVFIDDSPVERARVREAVPEVLVPEWPQDKMQYRKALLSLRCFDTPTLSKEDLERTRMYVSERHRKSLREKVVSLDEWYRTLETKVTVEELRDANLSRAAQLLNKTNQMNLSTRRMTEAEFASWAHGDGCKLWVFRVSDKFGDAGLTGIISLETEGRVGKITDFVLSCRVMGRKIEEMMLHTLITYARSLELEEVYARYIPTPKNRPCLRFFQNSGLEDVGESVFRWNLNRDYPKPEYIELEVR
jgi:FkbH-like protein